jgi:hypothetical protein
MNTTLKYLLIVLAIPVVIFVFTLIVFNVPDQNPSGGGGGDTTGSVITGPPLQFKSTEISFNPTSENLSSRFFPGYFEISDQVLPVSFWFQNPHPVPVRVKVVSRSCSQCTHARLGVLPDAEVQKFLTRAAVDSVTAGPFSPPNLLAGLSAALLMDSAKWHNFSFEQVDESAGSVPAAPPGGATWGIYQMGIKVAVHGPKPLDSTLDMQAGSNKDEKLMFRVVLYGVPPFAVSPESVKLGEMAESTPDRTATVYYWSATRDARTLAYPTLTYNPGDPFLTVGKPELVPPSESASIASTLLGDAKGVPILALYRFPVTVHRRRPDADRNPNAGPAEPDIGPFNRTIGITCPGTTHAVSLQVSATITGLVNLTEGGKIDLGSFEGRFGVEKSVEILSERPGIQLAVAEKEHTPSYLVVSLSPPRAEAGRRRWTLKVGIPGDVILGDLPPDSYVVLRAKTNSGVQRVRIPIVGRGSTRR